MNASDVLILVGAILLALTLVLGDIQIRREAEERRRQEEEPE